MQVKAGPYVLLAMATEGRGEGLRPVVEQLELAAEVFTDVERLLYHTRGSVPEAIVLEHGLVDKVAQLDLVALLRRRASLVDVPLVYLGPPHVEGLRRRGLQRRDAGGVAGEQDDRGVVTELHQEGRGRDAGGISDAGGHVDEHRDPVLDGGPLRLGERDDQRGQRGHSPRSTAAARQQRNQQQCQQRPG